MSSSAVARFHCLLPTPQLFFGWYILRLTSHLCNSFHACLWHQDMCFLSQHHLCICGASPGLLAYLWIKQGAQWRKACKCTFSLALHCTHIKGTSFRVAGRSGSSNTGCSLVRRANWGLRLSGSYSPLQVLLWNSCDTRRFLMWYKMYAFYTQRVSFNGRY